MDLLSFTSPAREDPMKATISKTDGKDTNMKQQQKKKKKKTLAPREAEFYLPGILRTWPKPMWHRPKVCKNGRIPRDRGSSRYDRGWQLDLILPLGNLSSDR